MALVQEKFKSVSYENAHEKLKQFQANEIFIGLIGHVGSGISFVGKALEAQLKKEGFDDVIIIKASEAIINWAHKNNHQISNSQDNISQVVRMQEIGNEMRKSSKSSYSAVAQGVVSLIRKQRAELNGDTYDDNAREEIKPQPDRKRAYIIDSIKHPAEVSLFREVYDSAFSLLGVVCYEDVRAERLFFKHYSTINNENEQQISTLIMSIKASIRKGDENNILHCDTTDTNKHHSTEVKNLIKNIKNLMERDAEDDINKHGQQVRDAFWESDYFIDNTPNEASIEEYSLNESLGRFIDIITHSKIVRPTSEEVGMHTAYSAQLRSSCLSRQVGSSILDDDGNIISTSTNDAPQAGGGIYGMGFGENKYDKRCFACSDKPQCQSNVKQNEIIAKLFETFPEISVKSEDEKKNVVEKLKKK